MNDMKDAKNLENLRVKIIGINEYVKLRHATCNNYHFNP